MNILLSSGLKWRWMENYGLRFMLFGGWIGLYDGDKPVSPDYAPAGRLLAKVTQDGLEHVPGSMSGGALQLRQPAIGILVAAPSPRNWVLKGVANGDAKWFRFFANTADPNAEDVVGDYVRLDGGIATATSGGEALILANPSIVIGDTRPVDDFFLTFTV